LIPAVVVSQTAAGSRPGVLLVSSRGKRAAWGEIQSLASRGAVVMAIDARGLGETRPANATKGGDWYEWFSDYDSAMTSVMLGSSMVAQRAYDIQRGFHLLAARAGVDRQRIYGAGQGNAAAAMLHAAAAGVPFARLLLDNMLASYRSVAEAPVHRGIFESLVPGALRYYDLPGLIALLGLKPVIIVDPVSPLGDPLSSSAAGARAILRQIEEPTAAAYWRLIE
jgi:hypothetical protein